MKKALVIRCGAYGAKKQIQCFVCNNEFITYNKNPKFCSRDCYYKSRLGKDTWNKGNKKKPNAICLQCSSPFPIKQSQINIGKGKYCSRKCYMVQRSEWMKDKSFNPTYKVDFKGVNNPNWLGGISKLPYPFEFNQKLKNLIRKRDGYKCKLCGCPENETERKLAIHHIDYIKSNLSHNNLVTLCNICNSKVNWGRKEWESYFSKEVMCNEYAY